MTEEIKKIELARATLPMQKPKKKSKILVFVFVLLLAGAGIAAMLLPLRGIPAITEDILRSAKETAQSVKNQDLDKTKSGLSDTRKKLELLQKEYEKVKSLSALPFFGVYIQDGDHAIKAGIAGLDAGDRAIEALEPNADLLGLKGKSTFVSGNADERIQTAVKAMSALTPKINEMAKSIDTLRHEIDAIDPARYPEKIRGVQLRNQMKEAKELIDNTAGLFVNAQPLLLNLPKMLGEPETKRYLVLFQNDKELRPTGGFITAYARFRIERGKLILEKAEDIYALDDAKRKTFSAPPEILKFHKDVFNLYIRDSNLSPDFKLSMQKFEELYDTVAGKENIDGIWAVDTHVLVEALKILGPMNVYGREFSAETDERCDCPRAVYELEDYATRPKGYIDENRKDIIGVLLKELLQKALGVSPSQYWGNLFQMFVSEINQKHVLAYYKDGEIQKAAESFNLAGRIMTASETAALLKYQEGNGWDYLHINNSNMAGAKSNMFVSEKITKDVTTNSDGTITTQLTVEYKNPYQASDCNLERAGLCLNAPLRNWVRIYVPSGSTLVEGKGAQSPKDSKPVDFATYESLGKTVFEGFLMVNPLGNARIDLKFTSRVKSGDGKYRILVQKQPGTDGQEFVLRVNGKEKKKMLLATDAEFEF